MGSACCTPPRRHRLARAVLAAALVTGACTSGHDAGPGSSTSGPGSSTTGSPSSSSTTGTTRPDGTGDGNGSGVTGRLLGLRLSEGHQYGTPAPTPAPVAGTPLSPERIAEIEAALPEWSDPGTGTDFRFPTQTLPPPVAGTTVDEPFPPAGGDGAPDVPTGPLEVVRHQPDGDVPIAPFVTITFNQPMVPVATLGQLDALDVPATITPAIPGHWQWIGTKTLRFDADGEGADSDVIDRLPMATAYRVDVPAGTRSQTGGTLGQAVSWTFTTPAVTVTSFSHDGDESLPLAPLFLATFDQRIDPAAVLGSVTVKAGSKRWDVRLATDAEIAADDGVRSAISATPDGRWMVLRPVDPFPADTAITITFGEGTPSAEGPIGTSHDQSFRARTYAALRVESSQCGYGGPCRPGMPFDITFNNVIDADRFDPASVRIEPALPGATVGVYGNGVTVSGATVGHTKYTVTLPAGLTDTFGQTLGDAEEVRFEVGAALPSLHRFEQFFTTLDPLAATPTLPILTVNHHDVRVRVFAVEPQDWPRYSKLLSAGGPDSPSWTLPDWPVLIDRTVPIQGEDDREVETSLDLSDALQGHPGHVVVLVEPTETYPQNTDEYWANRPTMTWAQATTIGIDATADNDELVTWTTDLRTGAALAGVDVHALDSGYAVVTDDGGVGRGALVGVTGVLVATVGDDTAILPRDEYNVGNGWSAQPLFDDARWYVFDDRAVYRPGETVSMKGWVRRFTGSTDGRLELIGSGATVDYAVTDTQGNQIATGQAAVNALGGFDLHFDVRADANLGYGYVTLTLHGAGFGLPPQYTHSFQIQEFRRPEFEAVAHQESPGPYLSALPATVAVDATYYSGGPVAGAPVDWQVTTQAASYSPPGWDEFTFGEWQPWWYEGIGGGRSGGVYDGGFDGPCCGPSAPVDVEEYHGTTDAAGTHYLQIDFEAPAGGFPDLPVTVTAQATVEDVNRQAWSGTTSVLVHPGELYVGLRSDRTFVRQGDPMVIDVIVTSIDGAAVSGRAVRVTASRMEWTFANGEWAETPTDTQTCDVTSGTEAVECTFSTAKGGTYSISSTIADDAGGRSRTTLTRWVSGADSHPTRKVEQETITIVPDRASYQPGDTAELLVQSPFTPAEGLLVITRNGIRSTQRFTIADGSAVVPVAITEDDLPGLDVWVEVVGTSERAGDDGRPLAGAPPRPAYGVGALHLAVPPTSRTLHVTARPRDGVTQPGTDTAIDVRVQDAAGRPVVGAELAVVVVDEAVLALSDYRLDDPLGIFYAPTTTYLDPRLGRDSIVLANPNDAGGGTSGDGESTTTAAAATTVAGSRDESSGGAAPQPAFDSNGGDKSAGGNGAPPIDVRTNFDALAVFAPAVPTDSEGRATIAVALPDNLTRYRVMVVAVSGADEYGTAESNITARLPLMVRPSAPRFANFGDAFELPVVVQNQTDAAMDVDVVLQTANLGATGVTGQRVTVPANDRVEVRFPVTTVSAGTASFRVAAVSGSMSDAATVELPVYTPATLEAFATYGVIDDGAVAQPLLAPTDVVPQFGGLEVTTSSTSLQALTDAVIYLSDYPYDSSDGRASRIMAITALRGVLDAFDAEGLPSPARLDAAVKADVAGLVAMQNDDGGFPYWDRTQLSTPYNSIQATHALVLARQAGYAVPEATLERALAFLADIESHFVGFTDQNTKDALSAYALNVRALAGDADPAKARSLWERRGRQLPVDAMAWIWPVVHDGSVESAIDRELTNRAVDTASGASFTTDYGDGADVLLYSDWRSDGLVLDALITERPGSDLIPKVVNGLLAGRTKGRWQNVQENAFILLALKHYFDVYESATPDFVAKVWLGDQFAGDHQFTGRSTDRSRIAIPTQTLIDAGDGDLVIAKDGTGRLYYRIGLRYAPASLHLDPLDRGFEVSRVYEAVDDPSDVTREADGTWHIKAGARVRVRLTMVAESQRAHVALVDPLPAGLEILNPDLAVTAELAPPDEGRSGDSSTWWWWSWFDHQNLRDDRAEAFAQYLGAGVYEYTYTARATTTGTFVVPPTRAEEIYAPETFGRTATDTVVIT